MNCMNCFRSGSLTPPVTPTHFVPDTQSLASPESMLSKLTPLPGAEQGSQSQIDKGIFNGREVAVKKYLNRQQWIKETECLESLTEGGHPNIIKLLLSKRMMNEHYCIFPLLQQSLQSSLVNERQIPLKNRMSQVVGIAEGACYLHQNGILHLDIKPANVLLDRHGLPKLCDFGIAVQKPWTIGRTRLRGSYLYFAPELYFNMRVKIPDDHHLEVADTFGLAYTSYCIYKANWDVMQMWDVRREYKSDQGGYTYKIIPRSDFAKNSISSEFYYHWLAKKTEFLRDNLRIRSLDREEQQIGNTMEEQLLKPGLEVDCRKRILPEEFLKRARQLAGLSLHTTTV